MFTKADAERYFIGEKQEALLFIVVGALALLAALYAWFIARHPMAKGLALPLAAVALIQVVVGTTVYRRADDQRTTTVYRMDMDPDALRSQEIPRMQQVMRSFAIYRWVEIVLMLAAVAGLIGLRNQPQIFWRGVALGLLIQATLMLAADLVAENRGKQYLQGLEQFLHSKT